MIRKKHFACNFHVCVITIIYNYMTKVCLCLCSVCMYVYMYVVMCVHMYVCICVRTLERTVSHTIVEH